MSNPFNVMRAWQPGDSREISERVLKEARLAGSFDSYSQTYTMDGRRWKIQGQVSMPSGETVYTLVCVNE